jgi:hypothetical protein
MGLEALYANSSGGGNTAYGAAALHANNGSFNNAMGTSALYVNSTGNNNQAFGKYALYLNTIGSSNISIGSDAGYNNTTANGSIFIGTAAGAASNQTILCLLVIVAATSTLPGYSLLLSAQIHYIQIHQVQATVPLVQVLFTVTLPAVITAA